MYYHFPPLCYVGDAANMQTQKVAKDHLFDGTLLNFVENFFIAFLKKMMVLIRNKRGVELKPWGF